MLTFDLGEFAIGLESVVELFANRFLIKLCSKLVEKEGKAAIKAIENKLEPKRVTKKPTQTRPPKSQHTPAKTRNEDRGCSNKRADNPNCKRRKKSMRTTTAISDELHGRTTRTITLRCPEYPWPCWHYSSVISVNPGHEYVTCPYGPQPAEKRPIVDVWNAEHDRSLAEIGDSCEADEWPPRKYIEVNDGYEFIEGHGKRIPKDDKQFIRFLDGGQNRKAGSAFRGCPKKHPANDVSTSISLEAPRVAGGNMYTEWTQVMAVFTRVIFSVAFEDFVDPGDGDDGLTLNKCANLEGFGSKTKYPGYALLNRDSWFDTHQGEVKYQELYKNPNKKGKRDSFLGPDEIAVVGSNSSRRATDEELHNDFGLIRCKNDCEQELAAIEQVEPHITVLRPPSSIPAPAVALVTSVSASVTDNSATSERLGNFDSTYLPRQTQA